MLADGKDLSDREGKFKGVGGQLQPKGKQLGGEPGNIPLRRG